MAPPNAAAAVNFTAGMGLVSMEDPSVTSPAVAGDPKGAASVATYQPVLSQMAWAPMGNEGIAGLARFALGFADLHSVQNEIAELTALTGTQSPDSALASAGRLYLLKKGLNQIDQLNALNPKSADALELRRRTASRLIQDLRSPALSRNDLSRVDDAITALRAEERASLALAAVRSQVKGLYLDAEDPRVLFQSELKEDDFKGVDAFMNPSFAGLTETSFWKTFQRLKASGNADERASAEAFGALLTLLRSQTPSADTDAGAVEARAKKTLETLRHPALASFFETVASDAEANAASGPREDAAAAVALAGRVAEDAFRLDTFADQRLTLLRGQGDVHAFLLSAAKSQLEETALQKKYFAAMGEEKGVAAMEAIETSVHAALTVLSAMDTEKVRGAKWDSHVELLGKTGKALSKNAVKIAPFFLRAYSDHLMKGSENKDAFVRLNVRIATVNDQKGDVERLKAGAALLQDLQKLAVETFVDRRIASLEKMRGQYVDEVKTSGRLSYVGNPYAGLAAINGTEHPEDHVPEDAATYGALISSYRSIKERLSRGDATGATHDLRKLENSGVLRRLSHDREQADFVRSLTTDSVVMAGSLLFSFGIVGGAVRLGLGSALARTSLSLGARSVLAELGSVAAGALPQTVIDRNVLKPEEASRHSFGHSYVEQLAFMLLAMGGGAGGRALAGKAGYFAGEFAGVETFNFGKIFEAYHEAGYKDAGRMAWEKFSSLDVQTKIAVAQAALVLQFHFVLGPAMKGVETAALRPLEAKAFAADMAAFKSKEFRSETESLLEAESLARRGLAMAEAEYSRNPTAEGERQLNSAQSFVASLSAVRRQMESGDAVAKLVDGHAFDPKNEKELMRVISKMPFIDPASIRRGANGSISFETRGFTFGAYSSEGGSFVFVPAGRKPSSSMTVRSVP